MAGPLIIPIKLDVAEIVEQVKGFKEDVLKLALEAERLAEEVSWSDEGGREFDQRIERIRARLASPAKPGEELKVETLPDILLDIKMSATNALAEIWFSEPGEYTDMERCRLLVKALKVIQRRALDAIEKQKSA